MNLPRMLGFGLLLLLSSTLVLAAHVADQGAAPATLGFEDRVHAQAAIEHVYHGHRTGNTGTFEVAVPVEVLEAKVRDFLRRSHALQLRWKTSITDAMLHRELQRMIRETRNPGRLWELFAALGNDPVLIRECLARPILVNRLTRNFSASDETYDSKSAWQLFPDTPVRTVAAHGASALTRPAERDCGPNGWDPYDLSPFPRTGHHAIWTGSEMIIWGGSGYTSGGLYDPATDSWSRMSLPETGTETFDTAVWTGTEMIVWFGRSWPGPTPPRSPGLRYNPVSDSWTTASIVDAPDIRRDFSSVWTGTEMIVWGGYQDTGIGHPLTFLKNGGRYDPTTDTWAPLSTTGAPDARSGHTAVWAGDRMIVWGGEVKTPIYDDGIIVGYTTERLDSGGAYDPATDSWTPLSLTDAPVGRRYHTAVWTGTEMIVWGGLDSGYLASGGRYDLATDTWTPTSSEGAPQARYLHSAVWTGVEMVVWGGSLSPPLASADGARYDPATNSWSPVGTTGAPLGRFNHTAVWTGSLMIVWGGSQDSDNEYDSGGRYDPASDSWTPTSVAGYWQRASANQTSIWTGNELIYWGFDSGNDSGPGHGIVFNPTTGAVTPTSLSSAPSLRRNHTAIWTGIEMIVWGGDGYEPLAGGGRYNPVFDSWTPVSNVDDPSARTKHTAVWTGDEMIVWGGNGGGNTGGRYDPDTDIWTPTSVTNAPSARVDHLAVWTGSEMIVCAGQYRSGVSSQGGRYDPRTDSWQPIALSGSSGWRGGSAAVWTGSEMLVWGGKGQDDLLTEGRRYDPESDTWADMTTTGEPAARQWHTAIWTGSLMVVWGGRSSIWDFTVVSDGAAYQPSVDGWTVLESEYAPLPRMAHTAVWTGNEMIVWGGSSPFYYMDAGFYEIADGDGDGVCGDDDCDPFNPNCGLDCTDADLDGYCVGFDCDDSLAECAEDCSDDDGDGLAACQGDCDDANPAVLPGLDEICTDNADNDCDGMIDAQDAVCAGLVTGGLAFDGKDTLTWNGAATANTYGLYRGSLPAKGFAGYDHVCEATELTETAATDLDLPEAGHGFYYLVAGQEADSQIDKFTGGPLGFASGGVSRPTSESITCGPRLYVDPDVLLEDGDGLSWYTAYSSVSYALEHPAYRDRGAEIWVRGTVTEAGVELQQIDRPGVRLLGGFSGTEVSAWQRTPELTPTIWSGGGGLTLFRASGTSVVFDSFTVRAAISGFVGDPAGRLTEFTNVRMEQISDYGIRLTLQNRGTNRLIVRDSEFVSTGLGAIEVVAQSGLLTGEIRDSVFADWTGSALKLETRAQTAAEIRLDILSNVISGGGTGIVIRAQVNDTPGPSIQSSFIGSNLIHGTTGPSLSVEAYGYFDFEDGPVLVDASPTIVGNTFVDSGGDGVFCSAVRADLTVVPETHIVRVTPELWDNLITNHARAGIYESEDHAAGQVIASPLVVGNGLFGNTALYVDEGLAELTLIEEVNALDGARHNFDEDPLYKDRAAQDYHLSFGTVLGFESAIRYLANDSDPGLGLLWTQPGFDASNWSSGHYGVGFDTGPPPNASALLLSKVSLAAVSVFSRLTFPVEDLTRINHLTLGADFDDGFVVWLNGVEVFRSASVPAGPLDWNTVVGEHESGNGLVPAYEEYDISAAGVPVLVEGQNLLAVAVWNAPGTNDLVLVPRLILEQESPAIDAAHSEAPRTPEADVDGERRENDSDRDGISRSDVGADERW